MKQTGIAIIIMVFAGFQVYAQSGDAAVKKGNDSYKKGDYAAAEQQYRKALIKEPGNVAARFNLGNAMEKQKKQEDAAAMFNDIASSKGVDSAMKARAYYNKGLALAKDHKLPLAVEAFKQSLRIAPTDEQARENLQKAMNEIKQQQQKQQQNQQPNQQNQEQNKPKKEPQPENNSSGLSKNQAEKMLDQLRDNEKQIQKQIHKGRSTPNHKKDW